MNIDYNRVEDVGCNNYNSNSASADEIRVRVKICQKRK